RVAAQFVALFTGIAIFIDDYFNSLAVGQIAKPITDVHGVSRAKLAYLIDSTGAPICILIPLSSWGSYIFSLLVEPIETYNLVLDRFLSFLMIINSNYYALILLMFIYLTIYWRFDFPLMKKHEQQAMQELEKEIEIAYKPKTSFADAADLLVPILVLIISTIIAFLISVGLFTSSTDNIEVYSAV